MLIKSPSRFSVAAIYSLFVPGKRSRRVEFHASTFLQGSPILYGYVSPSNVISSSEEAVPFVPDATDPSQELPAVVPFALKRELKSFILLTAKDMLRDEFSSSV